MKRGSLLGCSVVGCLLAGSLATGAAEPPVIRLAGDWQITVSIVDGHPPVTASFDVERPDVAAVANEKYAALRDFNPQSAGWTRGTPLTGVKACECTVKGALDPGSLIVRDGTGPSAVTYELGKDYAADLEWGTVGRLPGGRIKAGQAVFLSYAYAKRRIDTVVLTAGKTIAFKRGTPEVAMCPVPELGAGETRLANIFIPGRIPALTGDHLFPILETSYPELAKHSPSAAEARLPKTMRKLAAGEALRVLAWGDSVTAARRWQKLFVERLQTKYPAAKIELITEAWGGRNTSSYLAEPPGSEHNYQEKVLGAKPDLIVSEFVNDAYLQPAQVAERYRKLLADFQAIGAEWVLLTPHYVMPEWMPGFTKQRDIDQDPRPYVTGLRQFAEIHPVALADASLRYGRLWRQGIPYAVLLENTINHPNLFGHSLFADSLMALFP